MQLDNLRFTVLTMSEGLVSAEPLGSVQSRFSANCEIAVDGASRSPIPSSNCCMMRLSILRPGSLSRMLFGLCFSLLCVEAFAQKPVEDFRIGLPAVGSRDPEMPSWIQGQILFTVYPPASYLRQWSSLHVDWFEVSPGRVVAVPKTPIIVVPPVPVPSPTPEIQINVDARPRPAWVDKVTVTQSEPLKVYVDQYCDRKHVYWLEGSGVVSMMNVEPTWTLIYGPGTPENEDAIVKSTSSTQPGNPPRTSTPGPQKPELRK
jgi:hypothetical protein